ncbi:hypothetical protein D3C80_880070 [compost metagenome]
MQGGAGDFGEGVLGTAQVRQQHLGGYADQCTGGAVEHAVDPGAEAGIAHHGFAAGGEQALPDVLADQRAEEVEQEVGEDGVQADAAQLEEACRQRRLHGLQATGLADALR